MQISDDIYNWLVQAGIIHNDGKRTAEGNYILSEVCILQMENGIIFGKILKYINRL
jgi:hypothetical protein